MGGMVRAACSACSYDVEIFTGGGRMDFTTNCGFPALCEGCRAVVEVNHLAPLACPACTGEVTSYNDIAPVSGAGGRPVLEEWTSWDDEEEDEDVEEDGGRLTLAQGVYTCPRCRAAQLRFTDTGMCFD
ncbi:MAG: hypothetical protein VYE15_00445 [Myxococcota bacterium]|nr:hypothetical protein [Myxococcota bacterium]